MAMAIASDIEGRWAGDVRPHSCDTVHFTPEQRAEYQVPFTKAIIPMTYDPMTYGPMTYGPMTYGPMGLLMAYMCQVVFCNVLLLCRHVFRACTMYVAHVAM